MKKTDKQTKAKVNQVKTRRRELSIGELENVYGALRVTDPGTKDG
jgi:hypothetical protein